jgi:hypothetical protein
MISLLIWIRKLERSASTFPQPKAAIPLPARSGSSDRTVARLASSSKEAGDDRCEGGVNEPPKIESVASPLYWAAPGIQGRR